MRKKPAVAIELIVHHIRDTILQPKGYARTQNSHDHNTNNHSEIKLNGDIHAWADDKLTN